MLSPGDDRSGSSASRALLDRARPPAGPPAPGVPCRRDQRQGLDLRLPPRRARSGRAPRPRLHQPAPGPLQRAHPPRRQADRRRRNSPTCSREVLDASERHRRRASSRSTTAAAFLAFARTPADACIVEVGLGGRLDATNVIDRPLVMRHRQPRPRPPAVPRRHAGRDRRRKSRHRRARRAAGRASPSPPKRRRRSSRVAGEAGAPLLLEGRDWQIDPTLRPGAPRRSPGAQRQPRLADAAVAGPLAVTRDRVRAGHRRRRTGRRASSASPTAR